MGPWGTCKIVLLENPRQQLAAAGCRKPELHGGGHGDRLEGCCPPPDGRQFYNQNGLFLQKGACLTKDACSANRHCIDQSIDLGPMIEF